MGTGKGEWIGMGYGVGMREELEQLADTIDAMPDDAFVDFRWSDAFVNKDTWNIEILKALVADWRKMNADRNAQTEYYRRAMKL